MKYKAGDKVKIRTWEDMDNEYGVDLDGDIHFPMGGRHFLISMEKEINKKNPDRILTIEEVFDSIYLMEGYRTNWGWTDEMIKCLAEDYIETIPITNRFEILDL